MPAVRSRAAKKSLAVPLPAPGGHAAFDLLPIGIGVFDSDLRLTYANAPFGELRDLPPSLCRPGTALIDIARFNAARGDFGPGDIEEQVASRIAEIAKFEPRALERDYRDGRRLAVRFTPIAAGGVMLTYTDVTDARRMEQSLRENEERYALVTQAVAEGIYDWNISDNALWVSSRLVEIFGWDEDATGAGARPSQEWNDRVHPEDFDHYRAALRDALKGDRPRLHCEYRIRLSSGEYRWVEDNAVPVRDPTGWAVRLVGAVSDITERKDSERALREALEQQTATAEVLQVINSSPGDLAPVFDAMLEKAMRLCEAPFGAMLRFQHGRFTAAASRDVPESFETFLRNMDYQPHGGEMIARLQSGVPYVHTIDMKEDDAYRSGAPLRRAVVDLAAARTGLVVSLRKDRELLGTFNLWRTEVRPFTEKQIALVQNFAAQAVIAMENARLITETREALEQQTATAEVLQVINASPGDLAPVFDAMLEKATDLCDAASGVLWICEVERFRAVASRGLPSAFEEFLRTPVIAGPETGIGRLGRGERIVHIADMAGAAGYKSGDPLHRAAVDLGGIRSILAVALEKDGILLGAFGITRLKVRPFSDKQIALLRNFAAQAVIAMENARLITETREALEQQTATAEVLQVINSSPGDLAPVFDAMLDKAMQLCSAAFGILLTHDGERYHHGAMHAVPEPYAEFMCANPPDYGPESGPGRILAGERVVHFLDLKDSDLYREGEPNRRAIVDLAGARSMVLVPLLKDETVRGTIVVFRQQVQPFSDKQIALLRNFAAQAVIAMENARLLGELRERTEDLQESLEYQTATSDVLQVISRSTFDLQPVLTTVAETAARLCEAEQAYVSRRDGDVFRYVTAVGSTLEAGKAAQHLKESFLDVNPFPVTPRRGTMTGRVVSERRAVQIVDITADPEYEFPEAIHLAKIRTLLGVPLLRQEEPIGIITLARQRIEPFTERQIELVRTFADQAVIAIENTRLLTELRESLEQQTATAEVLQVINASPGDLAPVFETMLDKAMQLCEAETAHLLRYESGAFSRTASRGVSPDFDRILPLNVPVPDVITRDSVPYRTLTSRSPVNLADLREDESYLAGAPAETAAVEKHGVRSILFVPLLKEGEVVGCFVMHRLDVRPFSDKHIALLLSFAAQAVIAMDNARLLDEIRQRQAELRVTFDNMGDGVAMFDDELRLVAWNLNFQQIVELPDDFVAGRPTFAEYFRYLAARGEYGDMEAELRRAVDDSRRESRFERTRPDGRVIEVRRTPVPNGGFVLMLTDITERKRAEAEIRAARDAAEAALAELRIAQASLIHAEKMASLGQLTAGIAHEIKNPLNFVNNFAGLSVELLGELKETAAPAIATLDEDTRAEIDETVEMLTGNLEKIAEHGRRADGIVKSMLAHSRGSSGERQAVDLNVVIEEALNLAYHGARAQDQNFNVTLQRELDTSLAPVELVPQDMTRVFLNLFGNGFYAANKRRQQTDDPAFRPTLTVATRDLRDAVEIKIRDNGVGISSEHRDKLFQPFFTTKPTGEGTGLGLSISYDIVTQEHGGTIAVDSEVGEYTEFTITLPRQRQGTTAENTA